MPQFDGGGSYLLPGPGAGGPIPIATTTALIDAPVIAVNAQQSNNFRVILGGNRQLGAPINASEGRQMRIEVIQDATGSRLLTYASGAGGFAFGTGLASPTLTTAANKRDYLQFYFNGLLNVWHFVGFNSGYS